MVDYPNLFVDFFFGGLPMGTGRTRHPSVTKSSIANTSLLSLILYSARVSLSRFLLWFLALNVGCITAIIAGASLVAQMIGRLLWSATSDGSGNTAKRDKGL